MTAIQIYAPDGSVGTAALTPAVAPASLAGCRILALDNGKPGADVVLGRTAVLLAERTRARFAGMRRKGSAATPCEPPLLEALIGEADVILTGSAD